MNINEMVFEAMTGPGGHIPDESGPPLHGKKMGPGKGKKDGSGKEEKDPKKELKDGENED